MRVLIVEDEEFLAVMIAERVRRDALIARVRGKRAGSSVNAVRVTLGELRARLGDPPVITTVPGHGYHIDGPA
ncbi:helix-turn-helix domain-containing protein [Streptomyces sp. NPDC002537]